MVIRLPSAVTGLSKSNLPIRAAYKIFISTADAMFASTPPPWELTACWVTPASLAANLADLSLAIKSFSSNSCLPSSRNGVVTCFNLPNMLVPASSMYLSTHCSRKLHMSNLITATLIIGCLLSFMYSFSLGSNMIGGSFLGGLAFIHAYRGLLHACIFMYPMDCWHPRNRPIG